MQNEIVSKGIHAVGIALLSKTLAILKCLSEFLCCSHIFSQIGLLRWNFELKTNRIWVEPIGWKWSRTETPFPTIHWIRSFWERLKLMRNLITHIYLLHMWTFTKKKLSAMSFAGKDRLVSSLISFKLSSHRDYFYHFRRHWNRLTLLLERISSLLLCIDFSLLNDGNTYTRLGSLQNLICTNRQKHLFWSILSACKHKYRNWRMLASVFFWFNAIS